MAGTRQPIYVVTIEFFVYAVDDDDAADFVIEHLPIGNPSIAWAWTGTTLTNKGDSNE